MAGRPARLFLTGFPASGKSTFGQSWAERLGVSFHDTDEWITAQTGLTPERWILERGEEAFRRVEAEAVEALLQKEELVMVALGGGSLTIPGVAEKLLRAGWLLWIDPPWPWLLKRLRERPRPLQLGRPETEWHDLWMQRRPYYRLADLHWPPHLIPESYVLSWVRKRLGR